MKNFEKQMLLDRDWHIRKLQVYRAIPYRYVQKNFDKVKDEYYLMCIPMIYSHWECFVISCFRNLAYLINKKGIKYKDIIDSIVVFNLHQEIRKNISNKSFDQILDYYLNNNSLLESIIDIDYRCKITAESNLNYKRMSNLFKYFSIDIPKKIINSRSVIEKLVTYRNKIAHGENGVLVSIKDIEAFIDTLVIIFDELIITLVDYVNNRGYCK